MDGAEAASPGELSRLRQESWGAQADYVAAASPFFQALWDGRRPPARLEDLPELPLADKSMLRAAQAAHPPFGDYLRRHPIPLSACIAHRAPPVVP